MISGEKPQDKVWDSHSGGREFLLRLRGLQQLESERGRSLFRNSYTQMVSIQGYVVILFPLHVLTLAKYTVNVSIVKISQTPG